MKFDTLHSPLASSATVGQRNSECGCRKGKFTSVTNKKEAFVPPSVPSECSADKICDFVRYCLLYIIMSSRFLFHKPFCTPSANSLASNLYPRHIPTRNRNLINRSSRNLSSSLTLISPTLNHFSVPSVYTVVKPNPPHPHPTQQNSQNSNPASPTPSATSARQKYSYNSRSSA